MPNGPLSEDPANREQLYIGHVPRVAYFSQQLGWGCPSLQVSRQQIAGLISLGNDSLVSMIPNSLPRHFNK